MNRITRGWVIIRADKKDKCFWVYGTKKEAEEWLDPDDLVVRTTVLFAIPDTKVPRYWRAK